MKTTSTTYLTRRGDTFFFRMNIPRNLRSSFGQTEIMLSLKTTDSALARFRCRMAANWLERLFLLMTNGYTNLSASRLEQLVQAYFSALRRTHMTQTFFTPEQTSAERLEFVQDMEYDLGQMQLHDLTYPLTRHEKQEVEDIFTEAGEPVPTPEHPDFAYVGTGIREAAVEAQRLLIGKLKMAPSSQQVPKGRFAEKALPAVVLPSLPPRLMSEFIEEYEAYKTGPSGWNAKSASAGVASLRLFLRFMREEKGREVVMLHEVLPQHLMKYRQLVQGLPANLPKKKAYVGMTLEQVVQSRRPEDKAFDAHYAATQLARIKTFFAYAHELGYVANILAICTFPVSALVWLVMNMGEPKSLTISKDQADATVAQYAQKGYVVSDRTKTQLILVRKKQFSFLLSVVALCFCILHVGLGIILLVGYVLFYMSEKDSVMAVKIENAKA